MEGVEAVEVEKLYAFVWIHLEYLTTIHRSGGG